LRDDLQQGIQALIASVRKTVKSTTQGGKALVQRAESCVWSYELASTSLSLETPHGLTTRAGVCPAARRPPILAVLTAGDYSFSHATAEQQKPMGASRRDGPARVLRYDQELLDTRRELAPPSGDALRAMAINLWLEPAFKRFW
jgi:hypothetical protein